MTTPYAKMLVVDLSLLGDLLMTTPVLRSINNAWPECRLTYLCRPHTSVIVRHNPLIQNVLEYESRKITVGGYLKALSEIRRGRFDCALLLHRSVNSALVATLAGVRRRVGYDSEGRRLLLTDPVRETKEGHLVDRALKLLAPLDIAASSRRLEFHPEPGSREQLEIKAREAGLDLNQPFIALNPAGSWPTKRWTPEGFAAVADHFAHKGWPAVVTGGPTDGDICGKVLAAAETNPVNMQGKLSFGELYELLRAAKLYVSNDSGPMHLGVAAEVPLVAIFGPTDPAVCGPISKNSRVVKGELDCLCCYLKNCDHLSCMNSLKPEKVISAAEEILS